MTGKKIAFVGAPGTDISILQMRAIDMLDGVPKEKIKNNLPSSIYKIDDSYLDQFKNSFEFDLSTVFARRVNVLSLNKDLYIVSDEWALNELAINMVRMKSIQEKINSSNQILGSDGNPFFTEDHGNLIIIQSVFQVLINQVAIEKDFWDFLYYVPITDESPDILNEEGILPKQKLYQKEIDLAIRNLIGQLKLEVVMLPSVTEEAFKKIEAESIKWRQ